MSDLSDLQSEIVKFRNDRDWSQFHNPKDMAISLSLEASELLEHFQWKNSDEIAIHLAEKHDEVADELADVLYWVLLMSHDLDIDIMKSSYAKLKKNIKKYDVKKAKGNHKKYTEL